MSEHRAPAAIRLMYSRWSSVPPTRIGSLPRNVASSKSRARGRSRPSARRPDRHRTRRRPCLRTRRGRTAARISSSADDIRRTISSGKVSCSSSSIRSESRASTRRLVDRLERHVQHLGVQLGGDPGTSPRPPGSPSANVDHRRSGVSAMLLLNPDPTEGPALIERPPHLARVGVAFGLWSFTAA